MRVLWNSVAVMLLLDAIVIAGGVVYLQATDRLNAERVHNAIDVFKPTIAEQQAMDQQAAVLAEQAEQQRQQLAHLQAVAQGPVTTRDRLTEQQVGDELAALNIDRLKEDTRAIQRQVELEQRKLTEQKKELDAQRAAFEQQVREYEQQRTDADFQLAVQLYEKLPAKQVKQIFLTMIDDGQPDTVVAYLASMKLRSAANVLKEFKTGTEIDVAADLIERLRARGIDIASRLAAAPQ